MLGEHQQACETLQRALEHAPAEPYILRRLGRLALRTRDNTLFASCYRRLFTLATADATLQLKDEDFVHYARGLFMKFLADGPMRGKRFLSELQDVLRKQSRRFADNPQIYLPFQLINARMLAHQYAPQEATHIIDEILESCLTLQPELLLREEAELTFVACPELPAAKKLHETLNQGDSVIYTVEPDAERGQLLNRQGMELFEMGQFTTAKQRFIDAFRYAPDNVSVALNLLQTLLKLMDDQGRNDDDIDRCRRCVLAAQGLSNSDNRRGHLNTLRIKLNNMRYQPTANNAPEQN